MAISDHAVSDRAVSAPEDAVVVGVTIPGRCVGRARPINECEASTAPAGDALAETGLAGGAGGFGGELPLAIAYTSNAGSVYAEGFPLT